MNASASGRLPLATYRLQFNADFSFSQAAALAEYLKELGISDCYASPIFQPAPGSGHGYDVCDFNRFNSAAGGAEGFEHLSRRLRQLGLGLLLDMVPNHMSTDLSNPWWRETLQFGQTSAHAGYFDIHWTVPELNRPAQVLLPILEDHYFRVLEAGKLRLLHKEGRFSLAYYQRHFPLNPGAHLDLLKALAAACDKDNTPPQAIEELIGLIQKAEQLVLSSQPQAEELCELEGQLAHCLRTHPALQRHLDTLLQSLNGRAGAPESFAKLDLLLRSQFYRLCWWRTGSEEINYRRFFDITELVCLRMEKPEVFQATHQLVFKLLAEGAATGLRIDHPDGLWDPRQYLERLQQAWPQGASPPAEPLYIVVEKILCGRELLPENWPAAGTTGYDFLNQVNGLFVDSSNQQAFDRIYADFSGRHAPFSEQVYAAKKRLLLTDLNSELLALTRRLKNLSEESRYGQDFTFGQLQAALVELIAAFPVYRIYITETTRSLAPEEKAVVGRAFEEARHRGSAADQRLEDATVFHFLERLLRLELPPDLEAESRAEALEFLLRLQQLTGPIMAKGLEDTTFYTYNRLLSLNEVGGDPAVPGLTPDQFHAFNQLKAEHWRHSLLATSTHDTKRGEDARARINVLSEVPELWQAALSRWNAWNAPAKTTLQGHPAPDNNDEYAFYQTLLGAWTAEAQTATGRKELCQRVQAWMLKAVREAKIHTSWTQPNKDYEQAVTQFVHRVLEPEPASPFVRDFAEFAKTPVFFGMLNSLSQVLLKIACPGVPDFFQGTELWDLSLVDPDNRRPVDYEPRRELLEDLQARLSGGPTERRELLQHLLRQSKSGQIKLYLIWRLLHFRRSCPELFKWGDYRPLQAGGRHRGHLCAFVRRHGEELLIAVVPRLTAGLMRRAHQWPLGPAVWEDTTLPLEPLGSPKTLRNILTEEVLEPDAAAGGLLVSQVLSQFPVALLCDRRQPCQP